MQSQSVALIIPILGLSWWLKVSKAGVGVALCLHTEHAAKPSIRHWQGRPEKQILSL